MNIKGKLIYIFGIDGSGKTTLSRNLSSYLSNINPVKPVLSSEKSVFTTELEEVARQFNTTRRGCFSPLLRGTGWGLDLVYKSINQIEPSLSEGKTVILDRYTICNMVYTHLNKADTSVIEKIHQTLPVPDLFLYLDVDWKTAWNRILKRGMKISPKETPEMLCSGIELFNSYIKKNKIEVIRLDANLSSEEMLLEAIKIIELKFSEKSYV